MATSDRYVAVNGAWPGELPALTGPEAVKAFRMLYRHRFGKRWTKPIKVVNGRRRRTWTRSGAMVVAPDQGWHDFIHDLSHWMHRRQYPGQMPHRGSSHALVERDLIETVVNRGWLTGKLASKAKPKEAVDVKVVRAARVAASLKRWEAKKRRAETAIKKLKRQAAYYAKAIS